MIMDRGTVQNMQSFIPKNKFEKLVHLVGFIIRIYHNARSPERQRGQTWLEKEGSAKPGSYLDFNIPQNEH